ncbi:MAG: hypothetical protein HY954_01065 [Deltaproteobacteria bacterium]|nr:hypothetical protein [Deltaproteobacteria bacterium]
MKKLAAAVITTGTLVLSCGMAEATPSTHIWSPSTDVQAYGVFHLTSDIYIPVDKPAGTRPGTITNLGLTTGVLPFEKLNAEVGFDHIEGSYPFFLNAKVGIPENAYGEFFPALAIGGYSIGTKNDATDYNIYYAKAAKTVGKLGRFSVGYYTGNDKLLVDENGNPDESGVLLCWERTLSEISENLWVSVDYMGGDSNFGALSYGFAWKFAPNTSVIFGYVDQNNDNLNPGDTFTVQADIDFNVFGK